MGYAELAAQDGRMSVSYRVPYVSLSFLNSDK